jgi:hypothetical protein
MGKNAGPDKLGDILSVLPGLIDIPVIKFIGQDDHKKYNEYKGYQTKGHEQLFLGSFSGNALSGRRCHLAEVPFQLRSSFKTTSKPLWTLLDIGQMGRDSGYFFITDTGYDRVFGHQQGEFVGPFFGNDVLHLIDQIPLVLFGQIRVIGSNRFPPLPVAGRTKFIDIQFFTILGRG